MVFGWVAVEDARMLLRIDNDRVGVIIGGRGVNGNHRLDVIASAAGAQLDVVTRAAGRREDDLISRAAGAR